MLVIIPFVVYVTSSTLYILTFEGKKKRIYVFISDKQKLVSINGTMCHACIIVRLPLFFS